MSIFATAISHSVMEEEGEEGEEEKKKEEEEEEEGEEELVFASHNKRRSPIMARVTEVGGTTLYLPVYIFNPWYSLMALMNISSALCAEALFK